MYDAVILFAEALSELDRSQDVQVNFHPLPHPENKKMRQYEILEVWGPLRGPTSSFAPIGHSGRYVGRA